MPTSESARRAAIKYKRANIKRIALEVQKSEYQKILHHAQSAGETVNGYIKKAIRARMEVENDV